MAWDALPLEEAIKSMDSGDEHASCSAVQRALDSLQAFNGNSAVQREEQLLAEFLDLLSTNTLSLARKVKGIQAFMRARGRKLRDQEGRDDL